MSNSNNLIEQALEVGEGIVRLSPTWVPRSFCVPGRRLRLHPDDLYALGGKRGGIDERWFSSTIRADNGPLTPGDEGLSYIYIDSDKRVTLQEAIEQRGSEFLGQETMDSYGGWVMYSKLFDNMYPLPHHLHQDDEAAAEIGRVGKPEAYFFPAQYNFALNTYPYTFFGLEAGTEPEQVIECLQRWDEGDNEILSLSKAYRLQLDTGWYVGQYRIYGSLPVCAAAGWGGRRAWHASGVSESYPACGYGRRFSTPGKPAGRHGCSHEGCL